LAPVYEDVASQLKGVTNVAKVDVMASRDLGTRFDIKGFPTLLLFSKGRVYTFKGKRTVDDIVEFVRGGYQVHEGTPVPGELGYFGEIILVWKHAYKEAAKDLLAGNYFTANVFLMALPVVFGVALLLVLLIPFSSPEIKAIERAKQAAAAARQHKAPDVPLSSRARPPVASVDTHNSKTD
jgi:thioredoxin domain-containing protein 5